MNWSIMLRKIYLISAIGFACIILWSPSARAEDAGSAGGPDKLCDGICADYKIAKDASHECNKTSTLKRLFAIIPGCKGEEARYNAASSISNKKKCDCFKK